MPTLIVAALGAALALTTAVHAGPGWSGVGGSVAVLAAVLALARELARGCPIGLTRAIRITSGVAGGLVGTLLLVWPSPSVGTAASVAWFSAGACAYWTLACLQTSRHLRGESGEFRGPLSPEEMSILDRVTLALLPLIVALFLAVSELTFVVASLLVMVIVLAAGAAMGVRMLRVPRGAHETVKPGSFLWIGVVWLFLGQMMVMAGETDGNMAILSWGWVVAGAGTGLDLWMWLVCPSLRRVGEAHLRDAAGPATG